jgi:hypothetical protein
MTYLIEDHKYEFKYSEVKDYYDEYCACTDEKFIEDVVKVLHLACFICFLKEIPSYHCLSDTGIIHELVHMLESKDYTHIRELRKRFELTCKLA